MLFKKLVYLTVLFSTALAASYQQMPNEQKKTHWYDCLFAPFRSVSSKKTSLEKPFLVKSIAQMPTSDKSSLQSSDQELSTLEQRNHGARLASPLKKRVAHYDSTESIFEDPFAEVSGNSTPGETNSSSSQDSFSGNVKTAKVSLQEIRRIIKSLKYPSLESVFKQHDDMQDYWNKSKETFADYRERKFREDKQKREQQARQREEDVSNCFVKAKDAMKRLQEIIISYRTPELNSLELLFATLGYLLADVTTDLAFEELTHDKTTQKFAKLEKRMMLIKGLYGVQLPQKYVPFLQKHARTLLQAYDARIEKEDYDEL